MHWLTLAHLLFLHQVLKAVGVTPQSLVLLQYRPRNLGLTQTLHRYYDNLGEATNSTFGEQTEEMANRKSETEQASTVCYLNTALVRSHNIRVGCA